MYQGLSNPTIFHRSERFITMPYSESYHSNRSSRSNTQYDDLSFWHTDRHNNVVAHDAGSALHLGWENETDNYDDYSKRSESIQYLLDNYRGKAKPTDDGSLHNGYEIVSAPMTLSAHKATDWKALFDKVEECGGHSHDTQTCGLHVHVSRAALGNDDKAKALCIGKIATLLKKFQSNFACIARRSPCGWAQAMPEQFVSTASDGSRATIRKANAMQDWQGFRCHDTRRYFVLNLQNENTIEFRLFKGTLNAEAFYATLALVDGIVRWCKTHTTPELHATTFDEIIEWIGDETLTNYWSTRRTSLNRFSN